MSHVVRLCERCEVRKVTSRPELLASLTGQSVLLCTSFDRVDREMVEAGQSLRAVVTVSAGYNHVETEVLASRGVRLANTPGVLTDSVAEIGLALILATLRQTVAKVSDSVVKFRVDQFTSFQANQVSRGEWSASTNLFTDLGESLVGKTVGFIGLGRIGLAVAERLLPFKINPKIFYCNRTENIQAAKYYSTVLKRNSFDGEF